VGTKLRLIGSLGKAVLAGCLQYKTDASAYKAQARNATVSGILNTGSTLLSAFGNAPQNAKGSNTITQPISSIQSNSLNMDTSRLKQNSTGWA